MVAYSGGVLVPRCPVELVTLAKPTVVGALIEKDVHEVTPDLIAMVAYGALLGEAHSDGLLGGGPWSPDVSSS